MEATVRTRIAPSPTGFAHIGTIYQVLFDYVYAHKNQGQFIVRIEDTDRTRFVEGAEDVIYQALDWFSLEPDESPIKGGPYAPYRQSERLAIYQKYAQELIDKGHAYYCFCTPERLAKMREEQQQMGKAPKYDKLCLSLSKEEVQKRLDENVSHVIRMNVPNGQTISFHDEIAGQIEIASDQVDDQVLVKSDGFPTYHLAVVVDDYLMKISHIFRGTEWVPSTPKHVLLYQFFGWVNEMPKFVHLPLILNADAPGKLSKRNAAASVAFYKEQGYLPEAVLNYLSNIVWNHPDGKEIYSLDEFMKLFEIKDLQSKGAKFDFKKLDWMNGEYIRLMSDDELAQKVVSFIGKGYDIEIVKKLIPLAKERMKKLSDFLPMTEFIFQEQNYDKQVVDGLKIDGPKAVLEKVEEKMNGLNKPWRKEDFEQTFQQLAKDLGLNNTQMFQLLRIAVSGKTVTPPLFESIEILGFDKTLERVKKFLSFME